MKKHATTTDLFERTMNACSYRIDQIFFDEKTQLVREVRGRVPVVRRVCVDGVRKTVTEWKRRRWNNLGQCFSRCSNKRYRSCDLPLSLFAKQPD